MSYKLHNRHTEEDWALHIEEGGFGVWTCAEMYRCKKLHTEEDCILLAHWVWSQSTREQDWRGCSR